MKDLGHDNTDKRLKQLEKEIKDLYKDTLKEFDKELTSLLKQLDKAKTPDERYIIANKFNRLKKLELSLAELLKDTNALAMKLSQNAWVDIYAYNYNWSAYLIEATIDNSEMFPILNTNVLKAIVKDGLTPFTLLAIDEVTDKKLLLKELKRTLVNSLTMGESNQQLAKKIQKVVESNYSRAITIARTETTRIENDGRLDLYKQAQTKGIELQKQWVATKSERTRKTHRKADGQIRDIDDNFRVGRAKGKAPGQMSRPEETINCRCTTISIIKGYENHNPHYTYAEWEKKKNGSKSRK